MCTNYRPASGDLIRDSLDLVEPTFEYRVELWPGYRGPILIGDWEWREAVFGLVPFFSKDGRDFRRTYNARSETVSTRPSYRGPWKRRQLALVPMAAFYEPNYESGKPVRWRIERWDGEAFTVAAIWDTWHAKDAAPGAGTIHSFSMLTINADGHPLMGQFHAPGDEKRSLVVIPSEYRQDWLRGGLDDPEAFLLPMPEDEFTAQAARLPPRKAKAAES